MNLDYHGKDVQNRAVRYSLTDEPYPQAECMYWSLRATEIGTGHTGFRSKSARIRAHRD